MKTRWLTLKDEPVEDLASWVAEACRSGQTVHIGTDSLQTGRFTQFVTVVVVHTPGKGGRAAYCREVVPRIQELPRRLLRETWLSVEVGMLLAPVVKGELEVHIDASPPEQKFESARYAQQLVGMVMSQGFRAVIKPNSWAASHAADHIVRHHGKMPRTGARLALNAGAA